MRKNSAQKLVYSALFSALIFIGTQFIKIPLVIGYLNVGDCFVLLLGWIIGGGWAMLGAGIGAGLADILSGYAIYAPVTVIIKGVMALIAHLACKTFCKKSKRLLIVMYEASSALAELIMVAGYYLFEGFLYGFATAGVALMGNLTQGAIAMITSVFLITILESTGIVSQYHQLNWWFALTLKGCTTG